MTLDSDEIRYCFRCKDMAVIDPIALHRLPRLLDQAAMFVEQNAQGASAFELRNTLRQYAILIESVVQDG